MTKKTEQAEARDQLREFLKRDDRVYTILRHRAASGMTRFIDLYVMRDNEPRRITWQAAKALGWTYDVKREALRVGGCGMDMGFHAVYTLSSVLFRGENHRDPITGEDAGYSLRHEWL
jgi:hypothetical protein